MRIICLLGMLIGALTHSSASAIDSPTLDTVKSRGWVMCGVNEDLEGFSTANSLGEFSGFDVDICRAVAAAVFADSEKTQFITTSSTDRFQDLLNQDFDVLIRNTTWTLSQDASVGNFTGINFYDGQGFMVWKRAGVRNALELDNISLCVESETDAQTNATNYFNINSLRYSPVVLDSNEAVIKAYAAGLCDALTADQSSLAAIRVNQETPDAHRILSAVVSKQPLAPIVRSNDTGWESVVRWSLYCMINAEELGVTSENVESINPTDPIVLQRLSGLVGDFGEQLGLSNQWCANIIGSVGNYGESYERHLGEDSIIGLPRGVNNLWTNGGLIFAPPIR